MLKKGQKSSSFLSIDKQGFCFFWLLPVSRGFKFSFFSLFAAFCGFRPSSFIFFVFWVVFALIFI